MSDKPKPTKETEEAEIALLKSAIIYTGRRCEMKSMMEGTMIIGRYLSKLASGLTKKG